MNKIKKRMNRI